LKAITATVVVLAVVGGAVPANSDQQMQVQLAQAAPTPSPDASKPSTEGEVTSRAERRQRLLAINSRLKEIAAEAKALKTERAQLREEKAALRQGDQ
jgi:hypothetical protein